MTGIADVREELDNHRLELLRRRLSERGLRASDQTAARLLSRSSSRTELSDGQRRMWFVQTTDPTGAILNICLSYLITGDLDVARLRSAVNAVAARHDVLRTTYCADADGEPHLTVHDDLTPGWSHHDLSELTGQARRLRLEVLAQREFGTPFDLATDAPLRIAIVQVSPDEHVMLLVAHHIAWDDACRQVFFGDLTRSYRGERLTPAVPTGGAAAAPTGGAAAGDVEYWRSVLADPPEPLELPGPNGSAVPANRRSQRVALSLPDETVARVGDMAKECGGTPYMVLLAAFGALMHRYTHADDFLVATPVLNRSAGVEDVIGYYGNTVAVRLRPHPRQTFREMLTHARDVAVGAFAHQRVDLDRVVRELNPDRRHGVERMTRVAFGARGADGDGFDPPGISCERADLRGQSTQLPLEFMVELDASDAAVLVEAEYLVEVLDDGMARQLLTHYAVLLDSALLDPDRPIGELDVMSPTDTDWLRRVSTGEEFSVPATTLAELVEAQLARTPDAVAVAHAGRRYTYRELNASANRLAHWLIGQGVGTEDRVAVLLDRSPELVTTALGVMKAGAVYLPVDPTYPEERLNFVLSEGDPKLVLREPVSGLGSFGTDNPTDTDRVRPLRPDNTAYLIYTSGSTGLPKGVPVPHRPVAEYFVWFADEYQIDDRERLLQVASPSLDVSIGEIFGMLACGGRLVIPRPDGLRGIGYLTGLLHDEGITSMHFVPSLLGLFISLPGVKQWRSLQRVPIGGAALPGDLADKFHATFDALLHNFYGPTETVINASRYRVEGKQGTRVVPIGTPKINTQIHLLDDALKPVPVGVIGEIYIGGTHVAHGYHRRPGLTAERFVADPFRAGGRLYRSGDLARRNAEGDIEFVGRADEQAMIRGFRIELGEVAASIAVDPSVGQAVAVVRHLPRVGRCLVGYVTAADDAGDVDIERVRTRVAAALPEYMIPAVYVVLGEIPITTHGKVDRAALPEPELLPAAGSDIRYREPADGTGVDVGVAEVFERGTVADLAERIDSRSPKPGGGGVHMRFTEVAASRLGSVALTWPGGKYTYRELDEAADRVAAALVVRGVGAETSVAINLCRGSDYVVAMLGVLKAGGTMIALDPGMPSERIADIIGRTGPAVVVDEAFVSVQPPEDFRPAAVTPGQAAYVAFSSSAADRLDGVVGTQQALLANAEERARNILRPAATRLRHPLRVAHARSFAFDAAWQPLAALLDGHTVHMVDGDSRRDAGMLVETIACHGIDMIDTTPSMFAQLHAVGLLATVPLGVLALRGEDVGTALWTLIREECARTGMTAYNCYGPAEATVEAVVATITDHGAPSIGRPTAHSRAYVLDSRLRPVPDGAPGELYLAGGQLTRGYLGRPAETAERFVADPFAPAERMYRTGDVVRRQPNGALEFVNHLHDAGHSRDALDEVRG